MTNDLEKVLDKIGLCGKVWLHYAFSIQCVMLPQKSKYILLIWRLWFYEIKRN